MQHLHTDYERGLSRCLSRCRGIYASGSKLEDDTADRSQIVTVKLGAQSGEQCNLFCVESFSIGIICILNLNSATIPPTNSFNRVSAHEYPNIPANCSIRNIEFVRQIVASIVPSIYSVKNS